MADIKLNSGAAVQNGYAKLAPFDNILNFRDVGQTINEFLGEKWVIPFIVCRRVKL
jgi:protein-tyrosine phosphatase